MQCDAVSISKRLTVNLRNRFLTLLVIAALPLAAVAQAYPAKPVRLIVPFPAGGPADIFGRFLAQGMSAQLGQQVVIENEIGRASCRERV